MSLLLLNLSSGAPNQYVWAISPDGQNIADQGFCAPNILPQVKRSTEVIAIADAREFSWHLVTLPKGIGQSSPKLRPTLAGLLEEQLLDDEKDLHFAIAPKPNSDGTTWVSVCKKAWLSGHIQALEAANCPVSKIVPELFPRSGRARIIAVGKSEENAFIHISGSLENNTFIYPQVLPLDLNTNMLLKSMGIIKDNELQAELSSEPAVSKLAEKYLNQRAQIFNPAKKMLAQSRANWDIAQMEFAANKKARTAKKIASIWRDFLYAPVLKPARIGLILLIITNIIGSYLWSWQVQKSWQIQKAQIDKMLTDTFPNVKVVVDAPLQMQREISALQQASGQPLITDIEPMLSALGQTLERIKSPAPSGIEYTTGQLQLTGLKINEQNLENGNLSLNTLGYKWQNSGDIIIMQTN